MLRQTWMPWNLSFRDIDCTGQFTSKMKANAILFATHFGLITYMYLSFLTVPKNAAISLDKYLQSKISHKHIYLLSIVSYEAYSGAFSIFVKVFLNCMSLRNVSYKYGLVMRAVVRNICLREFGWHYFTRSKIEENTCSCLPGLPRAYILHYCMKKKTVHICFIIPNISIGS